MSWALSSLDSLVEKVDYGLTASAIDADGPRFLRITDLQDNTVDWSRVPSCTCSASEVEQYRLEHGDIVFARTGATTGKSYRLIDPPKDAVFASYLIRVRPKPGISSRYLGYFFQSPSYWHQITKMANGAAQPGVNSSKLKELLIPVPPTEVEQKRIAAILDKADAIRRKRQRAIALADQFLRSVFLDLFGDPITNPKGWDVLPIKKLGKVITGSTPSSQLEGMYGQEVPFVTPGDLDDNLTSVKRWLTPEGASQSRTCRSGSLMACCIGATIGKVGMASQLSAFNQQINVVEWNEQVVDLYGYYLFKEFPVFITKNAIKTTLPILKKSLFENVPIPIPDKDLQEKFASIVEQAENLVRGYHEFMTEPLFESLSQRAFSGEL